MFDGLELLVALGPRYDGPFCSGSRGHVFSSIPSGSVEREGISWMYSIHASRRAEAAASAWCDDDGREMRLIQ